LQLQASEVAAAFDNSKAGEAAVYDWQNFQDALLKREFSKIVDIGYAVLPPPQYRRVSYHATRQYFEPVCICFVVKKYVASFKHDLKIFGISSFLNYVF